MLWRINSSGENSLGLARQGAIRATKLSGARSFLTESLSRCLLPWTPGAFPRRFCCATATVLIDTTKSSIQGTNRCIAISEWTCRRRGKRGKEVAPHGRSDMPFESSEKRLVGLPPIAGLNPCAPALYVRLRRTFCVRAIRGNCSALNRTEGRCAPLLSVRSVLSVHTCSGLCLGNLPCRFNYPHQVHHDSLKMPEARTYSCPKYGHDVKNEHLRPYSNTRHANTLTYPSYARTQATRSCNAYQKQFSLSDHTLVDDRHSLPLESRSWRSGSTTDRRAPVVPVSRSQNRTRRAENTATSPPPTEDHRTVSRHKKPQIPKPTVSIDLLTISANGAPLETHLRNTKGNVHIKHLRIEDERAASPKDFSHRRSSRRRSRPRQAEKETESVSKLTRICELACVASLALQWKEYREWKNERS